MGRKRRTPADRAKRARENGYDDDEAFADDAEILKPMTDGSEDAYGEALEIWTQFSKSDETVYPHDMRTAKRFIEFYACGTEGKAGGKPTTHSIDGFWRRFSAAWARQTRNPISYKIKKSVKNFIHGPLQKKHNLPTEKREKHFLTLSDTRILQEQLWRKDWYDYKHERYRVQNGGAIVLFVCTSGRVGEFFESSAYAGTGRGLCYRDLTFTIRRRKDGTTEIVIGIFRQWAKGTALKPEFKPKHTIYEKSDVLWCSPVLYILALALADDAFKDYSTLEEILELEPPPDQNIWHLEWKDSVLKLPVFRKMSPHGPTDSIQSSSSYDRQLSDSGHRAGFEVNISVHDARREALVKADDNGYSISERMRFGGHSNPNTFFRSYMSQLSTVDGQGSFFQQALRKDHLEDFRGLSLHRHPQLWQSLPAKQQFEFECRPDIVALDEEIESLNREIQTCSLAKDMQSQRARRRELYERRRQLTVDELKQCRKIQPKKLTSQNAHETCLEDHRRTFFDHVRGLLPERDRLASSLFQSVELRSAEGRSALHDLVALCKQDCQTVYRPSLRPKDGRCPIPDCSVEMKSISASTAWLHLYRCYQRHLMGEHGFAQLCLQCDLWVTSSTQWEQHCQSHLDVPETLPLRCDLLIFRQAPVYAGCCPFCLGQSKLPASQRLYQFFNRFRWQEHLQSHIQALGDAKTINCPHPQCIIPFDSVQDLQHHLQDVHCVTLAKALKRRHSELTPDIDRVRAKRPRRAGLLEPHADNKPRSQTSPPGFKLIEEFPTLDEENKYTFIDCTAETLQSTGGTRIVSKLPRGRSKKPPIQRQRSCSPAGEDISFMDLFTCLPQDSDYEQPHASGPASIKSESTSPTPCFTPDERTAAVETPETSVSASPPPCIDPCLLEIADVVQPCPLPSDILLQSVGLTDAVPRTALCPVCRTEVDAGFLEQYTNGEVRIKLRVQMEFCLAHKKKSAEQEWAKRNYPSITWDTLKERLLQFHPILYGILDGHIPSFYRDALTSAFNLNNRRGLRRGRLHSTGYYGPRGSEIFISHIMDHFSSHIRSIAYADSLIAACGVALYVQEVLVPEIAMLLVKEDMSVNNAEARSILEDSTEIGEILNDGEDDRIDC